MKRLLTIAILILGIATYASAQTAPFIISSYPGPNPTALPSGSVGQSYLVALQTSGGNGNLSACNSGTLPAGLTLSYSGTACYISGIPTTAGDSGPFAVFAFDSTGAQSVGRSFTINITQGLQITTTTVPSGIVDVGYTFTFQASGSTSGLSWYLLSGAIPGLSLSSSGVLSGTPTSAGTYSFSVQVYNSSEESAIKQFSIVITSGRLRIIETSVPFGVVGQAYSYTLHGQGGLEPYQWTLGATQVQGITINATTGVISGTPVNQGSFAFPVTLRDSLGEQYSLTYTLQIVAQLSVLTNTLPNGTPGTSYRVQLEAGGGQPPYTWAIASGNLPPGLTLTATNGLITGTPSAEGKFSFTVRLTDVGSRTATKDLSITVGQAVRITTTSLPDGAVGVPYSATLTATGGQGPYTWAVTTGTLPAGLTLATTGVISGTPTALTAPASITVTATDSQGSTATATFVIGIASPLSITTSTAVDGVVGVPYNQAFGASGGTPPYNWSTIGLLPPGLQIDAATALVSGTPTQAGTTSVTIQVRDALGQTAIKAFVFVINEALTITTASLTGTFNVAFSQPLTATGGTAPYTWALAGGSIPAGLSLNPATGVLSGTPTVAGSSTVTFRVTDSRGQTTTKGVVITINLPPVPAVTVSVANTGGTPVGPAQQPAVNVTLASAFPSDVRGTLTLTFAPLSGGDDTTVTFTNGLRTLNFDITTGRTVATYPSLPSGAAVRTGTVAGTITITTRMFSGELDITPSPAPVQRIDIAAGAPVVTSVQLQQSGTGLNVLVTGYATTREVTSGLFRFAAASGSTLSQSEFTVQLTSVFAAFFPTVNTGTVFTLTLPVGVSGGSGTSITSVSVTLTNARGNSNTVSPQ